MPWIRAIGHCLSGSFRGCSSLGSFGTGAFPSHLFPESLLELSPKFLVNDAPQAVAAVRGLALPTSLQPRFLEPTTRLPLEAILRVDNVVDLTHLSISPYFLCEIAGRVHASFGKRWLCTSESILLANHATSMFDSRI